jgi:excisionase family DNA binding protein
VDKLLLTPEEAANALGIGRSKVYQLMRDGKVRSLRIGTCRRIPATALSELVAGLEDEAS